MHIPEKGSTPNEILARMQAARAKDAQWQAGRVWSLVYYAGDEALQLMKDAYNMFFSENGLNPSVFPSLRKFETEVVSMAAQLLGGNSETTGTMTSGGTESILMAVKTAKHYAQHTKPNITQPEIVAPVSAHPAFDKAAHYFGLKIIHVPVRSDLRVDVAALKAAITPNTIMVVGSAPAYPHGVIDPIEELATLCQAQNLWLHVDACVGGFMLPFVRRAGYPVPAFDFSLPGVWSMSADIHKYGYAGKGASVVLYKNNTLRKHQFFVYTDWPGGIYASPSVAGTRPGGAFAAAWAALHYFGIEGYTRIAREVMQATKALQDGINAIPELYVMSTPEMSVFAFTSDTLDIYSVGDELTLRGWHIDRQQFPASLHLTVNYVHVPIIQEFLSDLRLAVEKTKKATLRNFSNSALKVIAKNAVKILPRHWVSKLTALSTGGGSEQGSVVPKRSAAMYGMIGSLPNRGDIHVLVLDFLDKLNSPDTTLVEAQDESKLLPAQEIHDSTKT